MLLWATPWLAGTLALLRIPSRRRAAHAWSLALNSAALALICCLLRGSVGVGRESLLIAWLFWTAVLLLLRRRSPPGGVDLRAAVRRLGPATVVALLAVAAGIALFHREHFLQCFNGDGTEFHDLARSLRLHLVPYWEIEPADRVGVFVANPTIINSYWTLALQVLLGGGELATRLPYWAWQLAALLLCCRMFEEGDGRGRWLPPAAIAALVLLTTLWHTFYVGYDPYMADLANPGVPDMMFTLLILLALDCLRRRDAAGWGAMAVCASLLFYAGVVMLALMTVAALVWRPLPRRNVLIAAAGAFAAVAVVAGLYLLWGWRNDCLDAWRQSFQIEWFGKYFAPLPRGAVSLLYAGYLLLGCGGVAALGLFLPFLPRRRKADAATAWDRTVATTAILYLFLIFASGMKNLHYLCPLLPLPLILWLRSARSEPRRGGGGAGGRPVAGNLHLLLLADRPADLHAQSPTRGNDRLSNRFARASVALGADRRRLVQRRPARLADRPAHLGRLRPAGRRTS